MKKIFFLLAVAATLPFVSPTPAEACFSADCGEYTTGAVVQGLGNTEFIVVQTYPSDGTSWGNDPFNPLPHAEVISRTRFDVFVTDARAECPGNWSRINCPLVVHADGRQEGMMIRNYTHQGARTITVERIEYPGWVAATDASPVHFVAVEG